MVSTLHSALADPEPASPATECRSPSPTPALDPALTPSPPPSRSVPLPPPAFLVDHSASTLC